MDLYTSLASGFLFPVHESLKKHRSTAMRRQLEESQWWSAEQLKELQMSRLRQLLTDVRDKVPYYRDLLNEIGLVVDDIRDVTDLQKIPLLDKEKIRANTPNLKSDQAIGLSRFNTGGSSGTPLIFYISKERVSNDIAAKWRATRWWNVDIGDREIVVWGSPIELGAQDRLRALRDSVFRTKLLPAFEMSDAKVDEFLTQIRKSKPKMLFGYPSALSYLARRATAKNLKMNDLGIQVAFVTSESLYEDQSRQIQDTFGCRVANGYGSRDAGFIAHECPEGGMHISAEHVIVEIIDSAGLPVKPGTPGEIVVTNLGTKDFPFIRYKTGDIGILDSTLCRCGRGLPLLKEIQGRNTDFLIAMNGTVMHGLALIYILRDLPEIRAYKIVQESLALTNIYIAPEKALCLELLQKIEMGFKSRLGEDVEIKIHQVAEIPAEKSGKFRYVTTKVPLA